MKKQILNNHIFLCLLKAILLLVTLIMKKKVKYGSSIDIHDDPFTHSLFSISPILDSEIYVSDPSHFVHTSLIDGVQPSDFQDICLATSRLICFIPLTLLDLMCFSISSFFLGINTQSLLEYCEHLSFLLLYRGFINNVFP